MITKKLSLLLILTLLLTVCASVFTGCSNLEDTYTEAKALIEDGDYEEAYALFVSLGDYKDAAKQASYFRYIPTGHTIEYATSEESDTITYTITLDDMNLPGIIVEEYSSGYKHTCTVTHNEFGFVTRRACSDTDGVSTLYEATYDTNGKRLTETYTDADGEVSTFTYTYNEKGLLTTVTNDDSDHFYDFYSYTYDAEGRVIKVVYLYGEETYTEETTYNAEGKPLKVTWTEGDGEVYSINDYNYDEKGRLVEILFTEEGEDGGYRRTTYNEKDQLITEHVYYTFGYEYTNAYEYDAHGNAIKITYHNTDDEIGDEVTVSTYTFVYLPFDYTDEEWLEICDSTRCWDLTHW